MTGPELRAEDVVARIGGGPEHRRWTDELSPVPELGGPTAMPTEKQCAALGLTSLDRSECAAAWAGVTDDPALSWLWLRCRSVLRDRIGQQLPPVNWPDLPAALGAPGRWFYVCVFLSMTEPIRAWHAKHHVPESVSVATMADLGAKIDGYRRMWGCGGLDRQNWLSLHFGGSIFRLGRLQFERSRVPAALGAAGPDDWPQPGDRALDVHIPEDGPLDPVACDASFAQATRFFPRVFPDENYAIAICQSWLLDDQLAGYLSPSSNILAFRRRFTLWDGAENADADVMEFVFRRAPHSRDNLPRDTTLQRAVADHLAAHRSWLSPRGWLRLQAP